MPRTPRSPSLSKGLASTRSFLASQPSLSKSLRQAQGALGSITGLGWAAIVGLLVSIPLGWAAGWAEFRTLAAVLVIALVGSILWTLRPARYAGSIRLEHNRTRIGEQVLGELTVSNPATHGAPGGRVDLPVGQAMGRFQVPRLGPGAEHKEIFQVRTRRRSIIGIGPASTVRADPLGLIRRARECAPRTDLYVHPEVTRLESTSLGFLRDIEGIATQNLSSSDVSFHALRDYIPGDDRRSIHWRTTARTGKLMVRQFEETMRSHLLIVLALRPEEYADPTDFELAVSVAGSLALAADTEGREVSLATSEGMVTAPTGMGVLDQLCGVTQQPNSPSLRETTALGSAAVPAASVAAIITGGLTQPSDLRAAQITLPAEVSVFAVRCSAALTATRRSVGTLTVLDLAALNELPGALRTLR